MAVLMVSEWQGTPEQYETCTKNLLDQVGLDQRCTFHAMTLMGEGRFGVTEVWESPEAVQEWFGNALPVIEAVGVVKERQDFYDIYNVQMGDVPENTTQGNRMRDAK